MNGNPFRIPPGFDDAKAEACKAIEGMNNMEAIRFLVKQLAYAKSDGPIARMNDALNAAQKRNQTIAFLARDLAKVHGDMRRTRNQAHNHKQEAKQLRARLTEMRMKLDAATAVPEGQYVGGCEIRVAEIANINGTVNGRREEPEILPPVTGTMLPIDKQES
jgi:hypothetical protein